MSGDEELFQHEVQEWTVGQLREALAEVPDDTPLIVFVAEEPGGLTVGEQVVINASFATIVDDNGVAVQETAFGIGCEFPSGEYYR
jgi:hypothetical protein